jgi:Rv0078B-related antitoxin
MADGPTRDAAEAANRLRAALAMFETGVEMKRQTLRRENPAA